ncbi:BnaA01g05470D [Brassica napus]|uniref:BnaA01g05470D protein n=1 Tax=Brassica napus TaxID=3708 RepID=A0A078HTW0_BRANA|nr:BnaA01g05470D [Brassica napus]
MISKNETIKSPRLVAPIQTA